MSFLYLTLCAVSSEFRILNYYYYIRLTVFSRTTCVSRHQKGKPFWILMQQEMMEWQWHQLDHMQIICTSLQTDTSPLNFYGLDALPAARPTASKHWRQRQCFCLPYTGLFILYKIRKKEKLQLNRKYTGVYRGTPWCWWLGVLNQQRE